MKGYSTGTTGATSARFAASGTDADIAKWGVKETGVPPYSGLSFFESFQYTTDRVSVNANTKLVTDREWSAARVKTFVIKGTLDFEPIRAALAKDDLYPVACHVDGTVKAMASIWVNKVEDSVCGSYQEVVVSIDANKRKENDKENVAVAFSVKHLSQAAYAIWYNNFGDKVCQAQFLHSLYIDSPLSIAWGRQMQAFPKHPEPTQSAIKFDMAALSAVLQWGDDEPVLHASTKKNFGVLGFLRQGLGLVRHVGLWKVGKFLSSPVFQTHIVMPTKTAVQNNNNRPRDYTGHLWKGWSPTGVQVWPWNPATDRLELGSVMKDTGCEDHNGMALLQQSNFEPVSVTFIDKLSAVVTLRK